MYQSHGAQLAPGVGPFGQSVRDAVAIARQARDLSPAERQFLDDLARSEERYKYTTMERLTKILSRVEDGVLRDVFPEGVRAAIYAYGNPQPAPSLCDAIRAETEAVAAADVPELEVALLEVACNSQASMALLDLAVEKMRRQAITSRTLYGVLSGLRFTRLQRGRA